MDHITMGHKRLPREFVTPWDTENITTDSTIYMCVCAFWLNTVKQGFGMSYANAHKWQENVSIHFNCGITFIASIMCPL